MSSNTSPPQGELSAVGRPSPGPRREKPQLSCSQCRRRKSRCDRRVPCSNCASRGQICTYASQAGFRDNNNHSTTALPTDSSWQDRLNQLESLVVSLRSELAAGKTGNNDAPGVSPALINTGYDVSVDRSSDCGSMVISPAENRYVGREHWVAILDSIAELRGRVIADDIRRDCEEAQATDQFPRALLLYGHRAPTSRIEILESLPAKPIVDRYVSRYFNNLDLVSCVCFLQEYEAFWENPEPVPFIWNGLLFSIICLAVLVSDHPDFHHGNTEDDQRSHQIALFREKIVQCFGLGEYTKPGPHVLEAMIHYDYVEFLLCRDATEDFWFLLALQPRNLNDSDLDPGMSELPVARPETEMTTVLSLSARRRVLIALGFITDLTASAKPCSYAQVMRVDQILQEAEASIPPPMKAKPLATSPTDNLAYSRDTCLDASLQSLFIQKTFNEKMRLGGQLDTMRWRMTSIINNQFFTATMVLCLIILHSKHAQSRLKEILASLRGARNVWMRTVDSQEATKAVETINITLAKATEGPVVQAGQQDQPQGQNFTFNMNMWTNDVETLNSWINLNGPMSLDTQQP
ncbi:fungal-specific transcription factor domain-containing protein [Xylaria venustula]|nr:fungal-specific transcription factor domain-containing protein [Xylaria venustula]